MADAPIAAARAPSLDLLADDLSSSEDNANDNDPAAAALAVLKQHAESVLVACDSPEVDAASCVRRAARVLQAANALQEIAREDLRVTGFARRIVHGVELDVVTTPLRFPHRNRRRSSKDERTRSSALNNLSAEEVQAAFKKLLKRATIDASSAPEDSSKWCYVVRPRQSGDGYVHVKYQQVNYDGHALAYRFGTAGKGTTLAPATRDKDFSHLCHNRACIRPSHICVESRNKNLSRQNCILALCEHQPRCLNDSVSFALDSDDE